MEIILSLGQPRVGPPKRIQGLPNGLASHRIKIPRFIGACCLTSEYRTKETPGFGAGGAICHIFFKMCSSTHSSGRGLRTFLPSHSPTTSHHWPRLFCTMSYGATPFPASSHSGSPELLGSPTKNPRRGPYP